MPRIDLRADLNAEDDESRWWSLLRDAVEPDAIVPGAVVIAGTERFWSVVRIEQVDSGGQVHFVAVPPDDPTAAHLLARSA
jgi:hypothetical protein